MTTDKQAPEETTPSSTEAALRNIMEQAQVFASAWSIAGGRFDAGNGMAVAMEEKTELQSMVKDALAATAAQPVPAVSPAPQAPSEAVYLREALSNLCHTLPDILSSDSGERFKKTGKWATGNSYSIRGHTGTVTYRADDMECLFAALDDALAALTHPPKAPEAASTEAALLEALEEIDSKAQAGLCQMTHGGAREFLKDIRSMIATAGQRTAVSQPEGDEHPPHRQCGCAFCEDYFWPIDGARFERAKPEQGEPSKEDRAEDRAEFERMLFGAGLPATKAEGGKEYYNRVAQMAWEGRQALASLQPREPAPADPAAQPAPAVPLADDDDYSIANCIAWLDAKYRRHGEYEDKAAADHLRRATPQPAPAVPPAMPEPVVSDLTAIIARLVRKLRRVGWGGPETDGAMDYIKNIGSCQLSAQPCQPSKEPHRES